MAPGDIDVDVIDNESIVERGSSDVDEPDWNDDDNTTVPLSGREPSSPGRRRWNDDDFIDDAYSSPYDRVRESRLRYRDDRPSPSVQPVEVGSAPVETGPASVDLYIAELDEHIGAIVKRLRTLIREAAPGVQEGIRWGMPHYADSGHLVYIDAKPDHVNLGFFRGDELARLEPAKALFQGAGGKLRHIKLYSAMGIPETGLRTLMTAAVELNRDVARL